MPVEFTVDAYREDTFRGKVVQIRLNAQSTQNVVTYTVVIETDNSDRRLLPYMTANVKFLKEEHSDVLMVPTSALRWKPTGPQQIAPDARQAVRNSDKAGKKRRDGNEGPAAKSKGDAKTAAAAMEPERGRLWTVGGNYVRPIDVQIGVSDDTRTEVSGSEIKAGMDVVIGVNLTQDDGDETTNPFAPKIFKGGAKKQ
jgi:HlyD family secretion protein